MVMRMSRAEFRFDDSNGDTITVQCIYRNGLLREFAVIFPNRTVRLGRGEVGGNVWACESHARRAITVALKPTERRTPKQAREERLNHGLRDQPRQGGLRIVK